MHHYTLPEGAKGSLEENGHTTIVISDQMKLSPKDIIGIRIYPIAGGISKLTKVCLRFKKTSNRNGSDAWFAANQLTPWTKEATAALLEKFPKYNGEVLPENWPH